MKRSDILAAAAGAGLPARFRKSLGLLLRWECVYEPDGETIRWENDPADPGGATFAGLTVLHDKIAPPPAEPTARAVAAHYYESDWMPFAGLPSPVQEVCFVQGVNQGTRTAIRMLQNAINDYGANLAVDGILGEKSRRAAMAVPDSTGLAMAFLQKSRRRYEAIIAGNPRLERFRNGWMNRLEAIKKELVV
jgi:lysozyme family protein